jgi:hypothetical protein
MDGHLKKILIFHLKGPEIILFKLSRLTNVIIIIIIIPLFSKPMLQRLQSESVQINTK